MFLRESGESLSVSVCQRAGVILRQSSVHIKRNTSPPVTTQRYQLSSVCEGNGDGGWGGGGGGGGGGVSWCQE